MIRYWYDEYLAGGITAQEYIEILRAINERGEG